MSNKTKNKKKVILAGKTNEFNIRVIFTTEDLIEESLSELLNLSGQAVIDCSWHDYDDYEDKFVYFASEDGEDWNHVFFVYDDEDEIKEKLKLMNKCVSYFNYP